MKRLCAALALAALVTVVAGAVAAAAEGPTPSSPRPWTTVTMTVDFPWDGVTPETIRASTLTGCVPGDGVTTTLSPDRFQGNVAIFTGSKTLACAGGDVTLAYRVLRVGEATSASGTWVVTGGSGLYDGLAGGGLLVGVYTYDDLGQRSGIVDSYTGRVAFPSSSRPTGPPTSTWYGIYACGGARTVPPGEPFSVRMGGYASGLYGTIQESIAKDTSTYAVERPVGTPIESAFSWQVPTLQDNGLWRTWRWSEAFVLAPGEQVRLTIVPSWGRTLVDVFPASSDVDPTSLGYPSYDGTGPVIGPLFTPPATLSEVSCTLTGSSV
jgi:hypothetical protein